MLADMLKVGPPLLTEIIKSMESVKDTEKFVNLVQLLLPEYENDIMSAPRRRRVYKFCFYFARSITRCRQTWTARRQNGAITCR